MRLTLVVLALAVWPVFGSDEILFVDTPMQEKKLLKGKTTIKNSMCPEEGARIKLNAVIDKDGKVVKAEQSKNSRLQRVQDQIVKVVASLIKENWLYRQTFQDGKPIKVKTYINVDCAKSP